MICLAFYKGKGNWWDKLIKWWTGSKYSHCELIFGDSAWFSADAWQNKVRYTSFDANPYNWDYVEFVTTVKDEMILRAWCDSKVGKKYDWWGILGFILPLRIESPNRYFCSEICVAALQQIGKFERVDSSKVSPALLATLCGIK